MGIEIYNKEQNELLNFALNTSFFNNISKVDANGIQLKGDLELNITPECNLACKYCYINKNRNKLYPDSLIDYDKIYHNLELLLDYFKSKRFIFRNISLFAGEIVISKVVYKIFDILYEFLKEYKLASTIIFPSNMTFIYDNEATKYIQSVIDKFKSIGIKIAISASIDGACIEDLSRPEKVKSDKRYDDYYDKVFSFMRKNNFGFHPMISAISIKQWKDNYDWFEIMMREYSMDINSLMLLEVRDDNWTDEAISDYIDFVDHVFSKRFKYPEDVISNIKVADKSYNIAKLYVARNELCCSIQYQIMVRLGDLAITPCHRLSYDEFNYGRFVIEDDKIIDIEANNPELALGILSLNPNRGMAECNYCKYNTFCYKGCLGSQYEYTGDIFTPCESVCKLMKVKTDWIINKYKIFGVVDLLRKETDLNCKRLLHYIDEFMEDN